MARTFERSTIGPIDGSTKIAAGGQGTVYHASKVKTSFTSNMVYKEYKPEVISKLSRSALAAMPDFLEKLGHSEASKLIEFAAWPCALVTNAGSVTGFVMPAIPQRFFMTINLASGPKRVAAEVQHIMNSRLVDANRGLKITDRQRVEVLKEVAEALAKLHARSVTVGDISPKNLLFSLSPPVSVYFIDTDAMRVASRSVATQLETPGWEIPSGEELATAQSDMYKFGLMVLRVLVGDQGTRSPDQLPTKTPSAIKTAVRASITGPKTGRPSAAQWHQILDTALRTHKVLNLVAVPKPTPAGAPPTRQRATVATTAGPSQAAYTSSTPSTPSSTRNSPPPTSQNRQAAAASAMVKARLAHDWTVIGWGVTAVVTVLAPYLLGHLVMRRTALLAPSEAVYDGAVRGVFDAFLADYLAGVVVILALLAAFLLLRPWHGRVIMVVIGAALLISTFVAAGKASTAWASAEADAAEKLRTTAFPFQKRYKTCEVWTFNGENGLQQAELWQVYLTSTVSASGCNKIEVYRGWTFVGYRQLRSDLEFQSPVTISNPGWMEPLNADSGLLGVQTTTAAGIDEPVNPVVTSMQFATSGGYPVSFSLDGIRQHQ
ncbi:hypothetical protein [uncultured Gordonia sp.]|uniref:hypothetical protein n=1 Tax=uncultured Gordonia sp. TaxID=198437 RepID=UPI002582FF0F|nr:hypothetical protein [uncultured Gordonia sp.]